MSVCANIVKILIVQRYNKTIIDWEFRQHTICWTFKQYVALAQHFVFRSNISYVALIPSQLLYNMADTNLRIFPPKSSRNSSFLCDILALVSSGKFSQSKRREKRATTLSSLIGRHWYSRSNICRYSLILPYNITYNKSWQQLFPH